MHINPSNALNIGLKRFCWSINRLYNAGTSNIKETKKIDTKYLLALEKEWNATISKSCSQIGLSPKQLNKNGKGEKKYVLAMFPYPSGKLHMGHFRLYTISDALTRFHHMNGYRVFHPIGWDAFGLPAENAAIDNGVHPRDWTISNIQHMKRQLLDLGISFEWSNEILTCNPDYIKWTQKIFLLLFKRGLAYQMSSVVNWDPVDKTVLANEQVDANNCSWRSGAKVEPKYLNQWFINTVRFAKPLYEDLTDPSLTGWGAISKKQNSWIGKPTGYNIWLSGQCTGRKQINVQIWLKNLENLQNASFLCVKPEHFLNQAELVEKDLSWAKRLSVEVVEPLSQRKLPVVVCDKLPYIGCYDTYLATGVDNVEVEIANAFCLTLNTPSKTPGCANENENIFRKLQADKVNINQCSPILRNWLISRQRYWGTPIPIIHCEHCGPIAVEDKDLPLLLPEVDGLITKGGNTLGSQQHWVSTTCPKCKSPARRETDTIDTFFDSSFYYLRYLDPKNSEEIVNKELVKEFMPVDLYLGGMEHSVLHLYLARFMHKFLVSEGIAAVPEPFRELMIIGFVRNETYLEPSSGKYFSKEKIDLTASPPVLKETGQKVEIKVEKMSKSKMNGVDPQEALDTYGIDVVRLAMLNTTISEKILWNVMKEDLKAATNILKRFHKTFREYAITKSNGIDITTRLPTETVCKVNKNIKFNRELHLSDLSFTRENFHIFTNIKKFMCLLHQSITLDIPYEMIWSEEYEKTLRLILVLLYPLCPHFAAAYWNLVNLHSNENLGDIMHQEWPVCQKSVKYRFLVKVNQRTIYPQMLFSQAELAEFTEDRYEELALSFPEVQKAIKNRTYKKKILEICRDRNQVYFTIFCKMNEE